MRTKWVRLTRRTDDPKLQWFQGRLDELGIPNRRNGHSFHAPILEVDSERYGDAYAVLEPVDDIPDDDERFKQ